MGGGGISRALEIQADRGGGGVWVDLLKLHFKGPSVVKIYLV